MGKSDHINFGDILMAGYWAAWVAELGLEPMLVNPTDEFYEHVRLMVPGVKRTLLQAVRPNDVLAGIYFGGGYFGQTITSPLGWIGKWGNESPFWRFHLYLSKNKIPYAGFSVEIGPIFNFAAKKKITSIISSASLFVARNNKSASYASKLTNKSIPEGGDVIFEVESSCIDKNTGNLGVDKLAVHVTDKVSNRSARTRSFLNAIVAVDGIRAMSEVILIFDAPASDDQLEAVKWLTERIQSPTRISHFKNCRETINSVSACSHLITTKLHLGVTALAKRKNVLCFSDHPKVARFYKQNKFESNLETFNFSSGTQKKRQISKFISTKKIVRRPNVENFYEVETKRWLMSLEGAI